MDIRCKKFKVGDWIVSDCNNVAYIESISETMYNLQCKDGFHEKMTIEYIDRNWHLWSIQDAKDGDVLFANIHKWEIWGDTSDLPLIVPTLLIYQEVKTDKDHIHSYCTLYDNHKFKKILYIYKTMFYNCDFNIRGIFPATKEQRDILLKKIHETGFEWDDEEKKLKKLK